MSALIDLLVPPRCLGCSAVVASLALAWCHRCAETAETLRLEGATSACRRCAGPAVAGHGCWPAGAAIGRTVAVWQFVDPVAMAITAVKDRGARQGLHPLGLELADAVRSRLAGDPRGWRPDVVTWVPADPRRRRARGHDHAARLAAEVALAIDVPVIALLRAKARVDQTARSSQARREVSQDAFVAVRRLPAGRVLLVDDVLTTGATADRAARVLRAAGVAEVSLAVVARAGGHRLVGRHARSRRVVVR